MHNEIKFTIYLYSSKNLNNVLIGNWLPLQIVPALYDPSEYAFSLEKHNTIFHFMLLQYLIFLEYYLACIENWNFGIVCIPASLSSSFHHCWLWPLFFVIFYFNLDKFAFFIRLQSGRLIALRQFMRTMRSTACLTPKWL